MPTTIIFSNPSSVVDQRVRLSNSQFARPFDIGTWNKLRIGMRWCATDIGSNPLGNLRFFCGLTSGTVDLPGDPTCQHFVGAYCDGVFGVRTASTEGVSRYNLPNFFGATKIGTVVSNELNGLATSNGIQIGLPLHQDGRGLFIMDITKGSPNWTLRILAYRIGSSGLAYNLSLTNFLDYMETETFSAPSGHAAGTARTRPVDEITNGVLDSVYLSWGRTNPSVDVSDLALAKFA